MIEMNRACSLQLLVAKSCELVNPNYYVQSSKREGEREGRVKLLMNNVSTEGDAKRALS